VVRARPGSDGRLDEAVAEIKRARQTDPLSAIVNTDEAEILYFDRNYDEASGRLARPLKWIRTLRIAPRMARIYDQKHMFPEAIAEGKQAVALSGDDTWMLLELAHTYLLAGKKTEMQNCLNRVAGLSPAVRCPT